MTSINPNISSSFLTRTSEKLFNFTNRMYVKLFLIPKLRRVDVPIDPDFSLSYPALSDMWISLLNEKRMKKPTLVPFAAFNVKPRRLKRFLLFQSNELISADSLKPFDLMVCTNGLGINTLSSRMSAYRKELWVRYMTPTLENLT